MKPLIVVSTEAPTGGGMPKELNNTRSRAQPNERQRVVQATAPRML